MALGLILGACLRRAADNGSATADCTDPPHSTEKTTMKRERLEGELFLDKTVIRQATGNRGQSPKATRIIPHHWQNVRHQWQSHRRGTPAFVPVSGATTSCSIDRETRQEVGHVA